MSREEIVALVEELGGAEQHTARLQRLLTALIAESRQASVLTIRLDPLEPVSLPQVETWRSEPPTLRSLGDELLAEVGGTTALSDGSRYADRGLLGRGGMGEVRRVSDADLGRTMAMKIASPMVMSRPASLARFVEEAQVTAQLQHPGIVSVHELGQLPDGAYYFTMAEVRGRTLGSVIADVHAVSGRDRWEITPRAGRFGAWLMRSCASARRWRMPTIAGWYIAISSPRT